MICGSWSAPAVLRVLASGAARVGVLLVLDHGDLAGRGIPDPAQDQRLEPFVGVRDRLGRRCLHPRTGTGGQRRLDHRNRVHTDLSLAGPCRLIPRPSPPAIATAPPPRVEGGKDWNLERRPHCCRPPETNAHVLIYSR
jgi:hypothetical protein